MLKYCQNHKCHTYDTKDRKRGSKGNRVNQTRRRSEFYYGGGNFCSMNCYNDWASDFMDRAIDQVSGRITEPYILKEENDDLNPINWYFGDCITSAGAQVCYLDSLLAIYIKLNLLLLDTDLNNNGIKSLLDRISKFF